MESPAVPRPAEVPAEIIGLMNEKLVPCTLRSPEPTGPIRLIWMKVETPETISAMLTR